MCSVILQSRTNAANFCDKIKASSNVTWKEILYNYIELKRVGGQITDHSIFSHVLKACLALLSFRFGQSVHASLIKDGFKSFSSVENSVMDFYAKFGRLSCAANVFDSIEAKDSVSWNIILRAHLDSSALEEGLDLFVRARSFGFEPNVSTLVHLIRAYHSLRAYEHGQAFHGYLIRTGLWALTSVQNSLLGLYADTRMDYAEKLFSEIHDKDVISRSVMIGAYVNNDDIFFTLKTFREMVSESEIRADGKTMVTVLRGCARLGDISVGKSIHNYVLVRGLNVDLFVQNTLIDLYCKCGDLDSAIEAFNEVPHKNLVSWNSLLSGFVHNEAYIEALTLFADMKNSELDADEVTLVNLIQTCKFIGNLRQIKSIHSRFFRHGLKLNDLATNSLIDAYAKCNQIECSQRLFSQINRPDAVTWSTLISSFTYCGMPDKAIATYSTLKQTSLGMINSVTLLNLLEACALYAEITRSKASHGIATRMGLSSDVIIGTAVLDMYSKCGAIEDSRKVFDQISAKSVISYSAMISAYGLNGLPHDALALLSEMEVQNLKPNPVTTLSLLSACCHGGLVMEGLSAFESLSRLHKVEIIPEHYSCLVDLLARSGNLDDALEMIKSTPHGFEAKASAWGAFLSACRNYQTAKFSDDAVSEILELEPSNSSGYLLASYVNAAKDSWTGVYKMRRLMKEKGVKTVAGYSSVHVDNNVCSFTAGDDKYHPLAYMLSPVLKQLHLCMKMDTWAENCL